MIKKITIFVLLMMIILSTTATNSAYSGDSYEIQTPDSFSSELNNYMENYWGDENGNSVNIQISEIKSANEFQYSEEFLNALINEITNNIDQYRAEIKEEMIQQYEAGLSGLNVSREEIEKIVNPVVEKMEYKDFLVKEVTTFTKNNYPCLHYISNLSTGEQNIYTETYQLVSDKTAYTITISSNDSNFFEKQEIKDMVNSFTIKDYKEYAFVQNKSTAKKIERIAIYVCVVAVLGAISSIIQKKANKKKEDA